MLTITFLACIAATDKAPTDTADSGDTGAVGDSDDTADSADTHESHDTAAPEYGSVAGTTGIQLDFTFTQTADSADVIRYGFWTNNERITPPEIIGETPAVFPSSLVVELAAGTYYGGAFLDVGGDNADRPDSTEDFVDNWEDSGGLLYAIPVESGFTTTGVLLQFG